MEVIGQLHARAALLPGEKNPSNPLMGGWVSPRASFDAVAKRKKILSLPPAGN